MTQQKETSIFDSNFHRWYVEGEGEIANEPVYPKTEGGVRSETMEDVLEAYRKYVGDPEAELPQEILNQLTLGAAN